MTKYRFNELPDFIRENIYSGDGWQYAIRREWDMPIRDIVYVVIPQTTISNWDVALIEESNFYSIEDEYGDLVMQFGSKAKGLSLAIPLRTTDKGKLVVPDDSRGARLIEIAEGLYSDYPIYDEWDYSEREDKLRTELFRQEVRYISHRELGDWDRDVTDEFCDELLAKLDNWYGTVDFTGECLDYSEKDKRVIECELITTRGRMYE